MSFRVAIGILLLRVLLGLNAFKSWPYRRLSTTSEFPLARKRLMTVMRLKFIKLNGANGVDNDGGEDIEIPDIDLGALMAQSDMPKAPQTEEEITEDSFEGFLRAEFMELCSKMDLTDDKGKPALDFESFYTWKAKMGIVFQKEEIQELYDTMVGKNANVGLMSFIELNKIIDESNAAEY
jgi:hypothetical protein